MAARRPDKRSRLITAAIKLFYEQGYSCTSLAEIAALGHVPLGNVYYYFKTKDELGEAVVEHLTARARAVQELWVAKEARPRARLQAFVQMHRDLAPGLARSGCPIAGLCVELRKSTNKALAERAASVYAEAQAWLQGQFELLGKGRKEAEDLAVQLLSRVLGAISISHVFNDTAYVECEMNRLEDWLRGV